MHEIPIVFLLLGTLTLGIVVWLLWRRNRTSQLVRAGKLPKTDVLPCPIPPPAPYDQSWISANPTPLDGSPTATVILNMWNTVWPQIIMPKLSDLDNFNANFQSEYVDVSNIYGLITNLNMTPPAQLQFWPPMLTGNETSVDLWTGVSVKSAVYASMDFSTPLYSDTNCVPIKFEISFRVRITLVKTAMATTAIQNVSFSNPFINNFDWELPPAIQGELNLISYFKGNVVPGIMTSIMSTFTSKISTINALLQSTQVFPYNTFLPWSTIQSLTNYNYCLPFSSATQSLSANTSICSFFNATMGQPVLDPDSLTWAVPDPIKSGCEDLCVLQPAACLISCSAQINGDNCQYDTSELSCLQMASPSSLWLQAKQPNYVIDCGHTCSQPNCGGTCTPNSCGPPYPQVNNYCVTDPTLIPSQLNEATVGPIVPNGTGIWSQTLSSS